MNETNKMYLYNASSTEIKNNALCGYASVSFDCFNIIIWAEQVTFNICFICSSWGNP